jgi:hypothetical protein
MADCNTGPGMTLAKAIAFGAALCTCSAAFAGSAQCPKWERGSRYPWQTNEIMRGDGYAWLFLDVDRSGYPFRCRIGDNNFPDPEIGFWLCKSYSDRWRAPGAAESDPKTRTFKRYSLIAGYEHSRSDHKARKLWFEQHPEERAECYPEPTRPDRLG